MRTIRFFFGLVPLFGSFCCFSQYVMLHDFNSVAEGVNPYGGVIFDGTYLYGATTGGGTNTRGTIYRVMPNGTNFEKLFDFDAADGNQPFSELLLSGSFLYGTAGSDGANDEGTVFKIMTDGSSFETILDFDGATNGSRPYGALISDGTFLYGMTDRGGANNMGVIYKLMPDGTGYAKLLDFAGSSNGKWPWGSLILEGGFLYGMTSQGGANDDGTLFRIMSNGTGHTKLLDFDDELTGANPYGSLISDGTYFYGMTDLGGANSQGVVFRVLPDGTGFEKLLDFDGSNGSNPWGSLISDGTFLYGVTFDGGDNDNGTLFKIKKDGAAYQKLLDFDNAVSGDGPYGNLFSDGSSLYGTTFGGGSGGGTVFKFGLSPSIVNFTPSVGSVGTSVTITGSNFNLLPADNSVDFNGTVAVISSSTESSLTVAVPFGATSGPISITSSGITITSVSDFDVTFDPILMSDGTSQDCDVQFADSGGPVNYGPNEDFTYTFMPEAAGEKIKISFLSFDVDASDYLIAYDGPDTSSPWLGYMSGTSAPADLYGTSASGEVTLYFHSNSSVEAAGWEALVSCVTDLITIDTQPFDYTGCVGDIVTFEVVASGTTNLTYQWQESDYEGGWNDLTDVDGFSGTNASVLSINTAGDFGENYYRCVVSGDLSSNAFSDEVYLDIGPAQPSVSDVVNCGATSFTLTASGAVNGQYRWYTVPTGGSPIAGEVNSTYTTPELTSTTHYYVAINDGTCESARSDIQAAISTCEPEPGFVWAQGAGSGGSTSAAAKILLTGDEDLLVFGSFSGTIDFDTGPGESILTSTVGSKVYMLKMDPDGTLLWAKAMGGNGNIGVADATMDAAGNYYLLIAFNLTADFDPGDGVTSLTAIPSSPANKNDIAIAKYDADGNFIWVRSIAGNSDEYAGGIESDADGNLYVTGAFRGTTNVGGSFSLTALGTNSTDILAASMDTDGNFLWAWNIGSNTSTASNLFSDSGSDIAFDGTYLYISGRVYGPGTVDFDPGAGTAIETLTDGAAYILKLNTAGEYQNHHLIHGGAGNSIAVDNDGNIYVTGGFDDTIDIDPGAGTFEVTSSGSAATYLVKLDPSGNFVWGASFTTWLNSVLMGQIFIDAAGDVYSTGYFQGTTDFDPGPLIASESSTGLFLNNFTLKLDTDGNFKWVIAMRKIDGGFTSTNGYSLAVNSAGDVYSVGGFARHIDFDPSECVFEMNNVNGTDFFIRKVSPAVPTVCFDTEPVNKFACTGSTATFATTVLGSDSYNFQWQKLNTSTSIYEDISNAGGYSGVTTSTLSINTTGDFGAGTYRCKVSGSTIIDDFSGSATLTIGPLTPPTATDASTCTSEAVTLTASGATAGQYRWYDVETGGTAIEGEVNSFFVTPELSETTTFYVAINNGLCESERVPVTATLNATLNPPSASDVTICAVDAAVLTATRGTGGQYRWYDVESGGTAISGETDSIYTTPALSATSTYYVAINDGTCESARTPVVVTVNSPPSAPSTTDAVLCGPGSASVTASGGSDGQYRWYDTETGGTAIVEEVDGAYTTPALSATTTYYVSINDGFCESARTAVTASISPEVTPPTTTDVSICAPGSATLTAAGGAEGEYRWYDVETAGTAISGEINSTFATPILSTTTSYYVAINNGTCESSRTRVAVEISSDVTPPTAVEVSTCADESATLTATGGTDGSYRWYEMATGGAGIPNQINSTLVTPALSSDATYYVAINDGTCESARVPVAVSLRQEVAFTSQPADQSVEVGEPASFSVTASGDNITYQWQKDLRNLEGETSAELVVAAIGLESEGNYSCTISNDCGSLVSEVAILTVLEPVIGQNSDEIIVYNAVAPNGNNKNEFLKIANIESHPGNSVEIYDRWGVKVFEVSNYDNQDSNARFEGRSNVGSSLNLVEGTYFYLIQASGQKLTGFLHLRR